MTGYWSPMAWVESRLASVAPSRAAGRASSSDSDSSSASPAPSSVDEESLESAFRASFARASLCARVRRFFFVRRLVPPTGKGTGWDQVGAGRPGGAAAGVEIAVATVGCCAAGCAVDMDAAVAAG